MTSLYQFFSEAFIMLKIVTNDIVYELIQYAPYTIMLGVIAAVALFVLLKIRWKMDFNKNFQLFYPKCIMIILMFLYGIILMSITLLSREPGSRSRLDLIPFSTISVSLLNNRYPIENILLFLPFGFMIPMLWNKYQRAWVSTTAGFLLSLLIEITQHLTRRGYMQTDDIITNTLGALAGYGLFFLGIKLKQKVVLK